MSDELSHYGVKGMKWGRRKDRKYLNANRTKRGQMRREDSAKRGDDIVKHYGSARRAKLTILGKGITAQAVVNIGTNMIAKASGDPAVVAGANLIGGLANAGILGVSLINYRDVRNASAPGRIRR